MITEKRNAEAENLETVSPKMCLYTLWEVFGYHQGYALPKIEIIGPNNLWNPF